MRKSFRDSDTAPLVIFIKIGGQPYKTEAINSSVRHPFIHLIVHDLSQVTEKKQGSGQFSL